jgi:hypothetical protein
MRDEDKAFGPSRRAITFAEVIALEAAIIVALWVLGRLFS